MELYATARSEKYFKEPLVFKPERWLRENKDENHAFSSLPFGFGTRMCLGKKIIIVKSNVGSIVLSRHPVLSDQWTKSFIQLCTHHCGTEEYFCWTNTDINTYVQSSRSFRHFGSLLKRKSNAKRSVTHMQSSNSGGSLIHSIKLMYKLKQLPICENQQDPPL